MAQSLRFGQLVLSNRLSTLGLAIVIVSLAVALGFGLFGARVTPHDPFALNLQDANLPPSLSHLFGTDFQGRDLFSRVIAALPIDLGLPIAIVLLSSMLGIFLGMTAGYVGGVVDEIIMRITDLFLAFPTIIMVLAVAATLGPGLVNAMLAFVFVWWPPYVRLVRGGVLEVAAEDFISISKALNSSFSHIILRGILPNIMPSVLTYATLDVGTALLEVSILGFLGIGIPPNTPELGVMVGSISYGLYTYPWQALFPAFVTMILVVGFSFLGEGAREASDVKVRPYILFKGRAFKKTPATTSPLVER
ncbi:MAG TPA: ABC transporter permease [Candidatus Saccharimonadales bacterium]|nr:ABC transporter permease [Candidatus Saccharimonadales bacterium]